MLTSELVLEGNLAAPPELRYTQKGDPVAELVVLVSGRRRREDGEWEDTETTRWRASAFGSMAEHVAESLTTGDRVVVVGSVMTEAWRDPQTGDPRRAHKVRAEVVAASMRWASVKVKRVTREGGSGQRED